MKKLMILGLIAFGIGTIVYAQIGERGKAGGVARLQLQNAIMHHGDDYDIVEHQGECIVPFEILQSEGKGRKQNIRFFTSYIANSQGEHHQRITIVNNKGTVVAEVNRGFRVERVKGVEPDVFMARIEEVMTIPEQNTKNKDQFGIWTVNIYADKVLVAEYPLPVVIRPLDEDEEE